MRKGFAGLAKSRFFYTRHKPCRNLYRASGWGPTYDLLNHPNKTTYDSAVEATIEGFGMTRLLSHQVADHLRNGQLKTVLGEFEPDVLPVHVVHREGHHASRKTLPFIDLAVERLRTNTALN